MLYRIMTGQKKASGVTPTVDISESERMAKIRELLVGPVIADESARVDQSVEHLNKLVREQREAISVLEARIRELEESQRVGMTRLRVRLLGMVEALLANEEDVRVRLAQNQTLLPELENNDASDGT